MLSLLPYKQRVEAVTFAWTRQRGIRRRETSAKGAATSRRLPWTWTLIVPYDCCRCRKRFMASSPYQCSGLH